mgnify:CR=1 FL=1
MKEAKSIISGPHMPLFVFWQKKKQTKIVIVIKMDQSVACFRNIAILVL